MNVKFIRKVVTQAITVFVQKCSDSIEQNGTAFLNGSHISSQTQQKNSSTEFHFNVQTVCVCACTMNLGFHSNLQQVAFFFKLFPFLSLSNTHIRTYARMDRFKVRKQDDRYTFSPAAGIETILESIKIIPLWPGCVIWPSLSWQVFGAGNVQERVLFGVPSSADLAHGDVTIPDRDIVRDRMMFFSLALAHAQSGFVCKIRGHVSFVWKDRSANVGGVV